MYYLLLLVYKTLTLNKVDHDIIDKFQRYITIIHTIPCNLSYRSSQNTIYVVRNKNNNIQSYIQGTLNTKYDPE